MRFLHIADIHLGYEQYSNPERFNDFSRAFLWLIDFANEKSVDFVLLAGDLFHKRTVDPLAMQVAVEGFGRLKCPLYCIEGNHEKAFFTEGKSWIDYLGETKSVVLLNSSCVKNAAGASICGIKYAGAQTDATVSEFVSVKAEGFTILLVHAGLEGQLSHHGSLSFSTVEKIKSQIDYLALGHFHKPFVYDGWVFNPGSSENVSAEEVLWTDRGGLLVNIDDTTQDITYEVVVPPRRSFHRIGLDISGMPKPEIVFDMITAELDSADIEEGSVVDLVLFGEVPFSRSEIDIKAVQVLIRDHVSPLIVNARNETTPVGFGVSTDDPAGRKDIEKSVLEQIIGHDARYRDDLPFWVNTALAVKNLALEDDAEGVVTYLGGIA